MMEYKKLIIFDNDGVLVDSEIIWHKVNAIEMSRLGFPMSVEKSIELFSGIITKNYFNKFILQEYGKTISDSDAIIIIKKTEDTYPKDLKPIRDISQVLDYLEQKHIQKCIATNGDTDYVLNTLTLTHLRKYFNTDHIFYSSMVKKGKPSPDIFLHAANYFRVDPKDCLVIEDHVLGIEAAKAAHMEVIGFLGGSHAQNHWCYERILKAGPTIIAKNAIELLDILKKRFGEAL